MNIIYMYEIYQLHSFVTKRFVYWLIKTETFLYALHVCIHMYEMRQEKPCIFKKRTTRQLLIG